MANPLQYLVNAINDFESGKFESRAKDKYCSEIVKISDGFLAFVEKNKTKQK